MAPNFLLDAQKEGSPFVIEYLDQVATFTDKLSQFIDTHPEIASKTLIIVQTGDLRDTLLPYFAKPEPAAMVVGVEE